MYMFIPTNNSCVPVLYGRINNPYTCMCAYTYMYPDAWAFSINYKSADRSTFAMYWGTFVMYPSFLEVALINLTSLGILAEP